MKKFKLVLVLLACVVGSLCGFDASASKTIYIVNEASSSGTKVYGYGTSGNDDWDSMKDGSNAPTHTQKWNTKTVYKYVDNNNREKVIFYWNNGDQTGDGIPMTDGALYIIKSDKSVIILPPTMTLKGWQDGSSSFETLGTGTLGSDFHYTFSTSNFSKSWANLMFDIGNFRYAPNSGGNFNAPTGTTQSSVYPKATDYTDAQVKFTPNYQGEAWLGEDHNLYFKQATVQPVFTAPSQLWLKGWKQNSSTPATVSNVANKQADGHYSLTVDLSDIYGNFFFESSKNRYVPDKDSGNEPVSAGNSYTAKTVSTSYTAQQFSFPKGVFKVDAWFEDEVLNFTVSASTDPVDTNPATILVQGYKPNSGTWHTFATLSKDANGEYPFSITVSDADWYKFVFVCNNARYTPDKNDGNEDVLRNEEFYAKKMSYTYNEQQFVLPAGSYSGKAWFDGEKIAFKFDANSNPVVNPAAGRTLYMHFGQNFHEKAANRNNPPKVTLYYKPNVDGNTEMDMNKNNNIAVIYDMVKVTGYGLTDDDDFYMCVISEDEFEDIHDACFWFPNNSGGYEYGICGTQYYWQDGNKIKIDGYNWDSANWTKYIYYTSDHGRCGQTYVTFDQWAELRQKTHDTVYLLGAGFQEFTSAGVWSVTSANMMSATATMGVFYPELTWEQSVATNKLSEVYFDGEKKTGAKFKMSWLMPHEMWEKNGKSGGAINDNRSWMTFNLGIIGYDKEEVQSNPTLAAALDVKIANDGDENVLIQQANTMPNNNYNQYNWFVEKPTNTTDVTLVIDLDGECESVTVCPFKPQPSVTTQDVKVSTYANPRAADNWNAPVLEAELTNGLVLFNHINVARAQGNVVGISPYNLNTHRYSVTYEFYSDGTPLGTFTPEISSSDYSQTNAKYALGFEAIPFGTDVKIGVRAKFTDLDTHMTFHSMFFENPVNMDVDLAAPTFKLENKKYVNGTSNLYQTDENGNILTNSKNQPLLNTNGAFYTMGGQVDAFITAPVNSQDDLAWYADFRSEVNRDCWAASHHNEHPQHANGGEIVGLEEFNFRSPVLEPTFADYDDEANNWAHHLGATPTNEMNGVWTIKLPEIVKVTRNFTSDWEFTESGLPATMTVDVKVAAVYPFLIDRNATLHPISNVSAAPRKSNDLAADDYEFVDGHIYTVVPVRRESAVQSYDLTSEHLTGVSEILGDNLGLDNENAPVEYFNLQGMRVDGSDLVPGVYIRRQGTSTEKMIIR